MKMFFVLPWLALVVHMSVGQTLAPVASLSNHLKMATDSHYLIQATRYIEVWRVTESRSFVPTLTFHSGYNADISAMVASDGFVYTAAGFGPTALRKFDYLTGAMEWQVPTMENAHDAVVTAVLIDGANLYTGSDDGKIKRWSTVDGALLQVLWSTPGAFAAPVRSLSLERGASTFLYAAIALSSPVSASINTGSFQSAYTYSFTAQDSYTGIGKDGFSTIPYLRSLAISSYSNTESVQTINGLVSSAAYRLRWWHALVDGGLGSPTTVTMCGNVVSTSAPTSTSFTQTTTNLFYGTTSSCVLKFVIGLQDRACNSFIRDVELLRVVGPVVHRFTLDTDDMVDAVYDRMVVIRESWTNSASADVASLSSISGAVVLGIIAPVESSSCRVLSIDMASRSLTRDYSVPSCTGSELKVTSTVIYGGYLFAGRLGAIDQWILDDGVHVRTFGTEEYLSGSVTTLVEADKYIVAADDGGNVRVWEMPEMITATTTTTTTKTTTTTTTPTFTGLATPSVTSPLQNRPNDDDTNDTWAMILGAAAGSSILLLAGAIFGVIHIRHRREHMRTRHAVKDHFTMVTLTSSPALADPNVRDSQMPDVRPLSMFQNAVRRMSKIAVPLPLRPQQQRYETMKSVGVLPGVSVSSTNLLSGSTEKLGHRKPVAPLVEGDVSQAMSEHTSTGGYADYTVTEPTFTERPQFPRAQTLNADGTPVSVELFCGVPVLAQQRMSFAVDYDLVARLTHAEHHVLLYAGRLLRAAGSSIADAERQRVVVKQLDFERRSVAELALRQEVAILRRMRDHDNIVKMVAYDPVELRILLAETRVTESKTAAFTSLAEFIPAFDYDTVTMCVLALDIACGLEALHHDGVVHLNLCADSIYIQLHPSRGVQARIGDIGACRILSNSSNSIYREDAGSVLHRDAERSWNVFYRSQESFIHRPDLLEPMVAKAANLYALGVLINVLVTKRLPVVDVYGRP